VVFSDSHGDFAPLRDIVMTHKNAGLFIHLGDGELDAVKLAEEFPQKTFLYVRGNCDRGIDTPAEATAFFHGKKIFYAHGQFLRVKSSPQWFIERAADAKADIALFGHTHEVFVTTLESGMHVMNPGSTAAPRGEGAFRSYGLIDIKDDTVAMQIVKI